MQEVINYLEISLGVKVRAEGNTVKANLPELDDINIYHLNAFNSERWKPYVEDFKVKRSGTGLVVIVMTKED